MALKQAMSGSELIINRKTGTLYHINLSRQDGFPSRFLLVGDPQRVREVAKFFDDGIKGERSNREFVSVWGTYKGLPVAAMGTGIGPDNTEIGLVEMHAVFEYDHERDLWTPPKDPVTLIRIGTSASPQRDVKLGTLAITEHAIGLDNTGLFYLHKPLGDYSDLDDIMFTPNNPTARKVWEQLTRVLPLAVLSIIRPYVSTATPDVVAALRESVGLRPDIRSESGLTTTAPGFFAPQGRRIGRLSNILVPDLQERLAQLTIRRHLGIEDNIRAANNEMETSVLLRVAAEILGYRAGAVCLVIANRAEGEFITPEQYARGVDAAIVTGLEALHKLG